MPPSRAPRAVQIAIAHPSSAAPKSCTRIGSLEPGASMPLASSGAKTKRTPATARQTANTLTPMRKSIKIRLLRSDDLPPPRKPSADSLIAVWHAEKTRHLIHHEAGPRPRDQHQTGDAHHDVQTLHVSDGPTEEDEGERQEPQQHK